MAVRLQFLDVTAEILNQGSSETEVTRTEKVNPKDTANPATVACKAKLKYFTNQVTSGSEVEMEIVYLSPIFDRLTRKPDGFFIRDK